MKKVFFSSLVVFFVATFFIGLEYSHHFLLLSLLFFLFLAKEYRQKKSLFVLGILTLLGSWVMLNSISYAPKKMNAKNCGLACCAAQKTEDSDPLDDSSELVKKPENQLTVMSFNIRMSSDQLLGHDGKNNWIYRRETVIEIIKETDPDLFGVQEALPNQMEYLKNTLTDYSSIGVARDDGKNSGEYSAVFFKKDKFQVLDSGTFWLSETPQTPGSRGWDAACNRIVSWGKFKIKSKNKTDKNSDINSNINANINDDASEKTFVYANTHFDHIGETAREESSKQVLRFAQQYQDIPFIISGDFNADPSSSVYQRLTKGFSHSDKNQDTNVDEKTADSDQKVPGLTDTFKTSPKITADAYQTFHNYGKIVPSDPKNDTRIDFIFVNQHIQTKAFTISPVLKNGRCPSDHSSVFAEILLK